MATDPGAQGPGGSRGDPHQPGQREKKLAFPSSPATHAGRQAEVVGAQSRARLATGISLGRGLGGRTAVSTSGSQREGSVGESRSTAPTGEEAKLGG